MKAARVPAEPIGAVNNVSMRIDRLDVSAFVTWVMVRRDYQATLFLDWVANPEPRA